MSWRRPIVLTNIGTYNYGMIQANYFAIPADIDKLNVFLKENDEKLVDDSLKIFVDKVLVFTNETEMTDQDKAESIIKQNLDQLKASLVTLQVSIAQHRRNAALDKKGAAHKVADAEVSRHRTLEEIAIYEEVLAKVKDGTWLDA